MKDGRLSKRARHNPEESAFVMKLSSCSKQADLHGALELYDKVKREGMIDLKQQHYNLLLYLCSAAAMSALVAKSSSDDKRPVESSDVDKVDARGSQGDDKCRGDADINSTSRDGPGSPGDVTDYHENCVLDIRNRDVAGDSDLILAVKRGIEIYQDMLLSQILPNEATFTSVARLAMANGDGDLAFETVKKMATAKITPRLRSYAVPLLCFCRNNQADKAFEVDDHICAAGLLPDENILEALLGVSIRCGLEDKVYSILHRLRGTVREVSHTTAMTIESWFGSAQAVHAGNDNFNFQEEMDDAIKAHGGGWHGLGWLGKGDWNINLTHIDQSGSCMSCGEILCTIDLDSGQTAKFLDSLTDLAFKLGNKDDQFGIFQEWLRKHGPYDAIIDGANVGLYNNQGQSRLNYEQVSKVFIALREKSPSNKPPLIILHSRRVSDRFLLDPREQAMIEGWKKEDALYTTPLGSNDDWYWLYAAVSCNCLLVTNDEMRDHIFQLLGNDFFHRWKEKHQVHFNVTSDTLELSMPPLYMTAIQESRMGSWHIPQAKKDDGENDHKWLCVTRHCEQALAEEVF